MKNRYLLLFLSLVIAGCGAKDKIVEQQQENLIMAAITTGQWKVTGYVKGGVDVTTDFSGYLFQFRNNYTVDALLNGYVEKTGSWAAAGDMQSQTMTANFANATNPLLLLNGTWDIVTTTWTSVDAKQTVNGEQRTLRLDKQ
jgi:hypothetical protein